MKKIRIGKDISINWKLLVNNSVQNLEDSSLSIKLRDPVGKIADISIFDVSLNEVNFILRGTSLHSLGTYCLTAWLNEGLKGQTCVDERNAFQLVRYTDQEEDSIDDNLVTDSSINLTGELSYVVKDYQPIVGDYVTEDELATTLNDYVKSEDVSNFVEIDDISNFVTNNDVSNFVTKSDISTYSNTFVVTLTKWNNVYEADKTVAEINAAFDQGMQVIAKWHFPSQWDTEYYMTCRRTGGGAYIIYMSTAYDITLGNDQELIGKGIKFLLQTNSGIKEYVCKFEDYAKISDISTFITRQDVSNCITEIKTINGQSLVGTGNIVISSDTPIQPLVAGDHIDITNNTISVTGMPTKTSDLTNDSGFLSAVPAEYITRNQLNSSLSDFYNKTYIDSKFDLYVTKTALNSSLPNYYTKSEMNTSLGNFYTKTWLNNKFNSYYTKTEINEVLGDIQNLLESI